jgi:hypothetical protein
MSTTMIDFFQVSSCLGGSVVAIKVVLNDLAENDVAKMLETFTASSANDIVSRWHVVSCQVGSIAKR